MKTILWKKPDNSIAYTWMRDGIENEMAEAAGFAVLAAEKPALLAEIERLNGVIALEEAAKEAAENAARVAIAAKKVAIAAEDEARVAELSAVIKAAIVEQEAHVSAMKAAVSSKAPLTEKLEKIANYEHVKFNIGLTTEEHAAILQARGDVPADWVVAAIDIAAPWVAGWGRQSLRWDGVKVVIDFAAAVEETKNRLRKERAPLLAAQDVAFQRALEIGAATTAIVAEKQRLRDLPLLADAATTLDELKALKA